MTYKAHLEQLLSISIQKSNEFIDVVRKEGQTDSSRFIHAKEGWEAAERKYVSCLQLIESGQICPEDVVTTDEHAAVHSPSCP